MQDCAGTRGLQSCCAPWPCIPELPPVLSPDPAGALPCRKGNSIMQGFGVLTSSTLSQHCPHPIPGCAVSEEASSSLELCRFGVCWRCR